MDIVSRRGTKREIVAACNEVLGTNYKSLRALQREYVAAELLEIWLAYKGLGAFADSIVDVLDILDCDIYYS